MWASLALGLERSREVAFVGCGHRLGRGIGEGRAIAGDWDSLRRGTLGLGSLGLDSPGEAGREEGCTRFRWVRHASR